MWLSLDTDSQYRFEGSIAPVAFFQHLPLLLVPTDTLVLGCYDARPDIRRFLAAESISATWQRFRPREMWDHNRRQHPDGAAFHLHANNRILQQLVQFACSVTAHIELCDHLAAYSAKHPLLVYHGTSWEPLFVSTHIPRGSVEAFSRGIGVAFEIIDFSQTYFPAKFLPDEPTV